MKLYDNEGKLLISQTPVTINLGNITGNNFAIVGNTFYFRDSNGSNATPLYESKTQVYQGIPNTGLADSGIALP